MSKEVGVRRKNKTKLLNIMIFFRNPVLYNVLYQRRAWATIKLSPTLPKEVQKIIHSSKNSCSMTKSWLCFSLNHHITCTAELSKLLKVVPSPLIALNCLRIQNCRLYNSSPGTGSGVEPGKVTEKLKKIHVHV